MTEPLAAALKVITPVMQSDDPRSALVAARCYGLMHGYDARWGGAPYRIDGVEAVLTSDLINPETQRKSRTFMVAGKIDVRATELATDTKVIFDHKTTSSDISDPNAAYWQQLRIEGQVNHYMLLEWLNGNRVDGAVWDVMRKPGIAPSKLTIKDAKDIVASGEYYGAVVSPEDIRAVMNDEKPRESIHMYASRLIHDCTVERPQWYFQRRQIVRLDSEIHEYATELWDHGQDILQVRQTGRNPRNSGACMLYGSPCRYLGLCSGHDTLESGKWTKREYVHNELPIIGQNGGRDVLTNSRIRNFQTCRRKHELDYEIGIERVDEEEREALFFGNLWHLASEAYFKTLMELQAAEEVTA